MRLSGPEAPRPGARPPVAGEAAEALAHTLLDFAYCAHASARWRGRTLAVTWSAYEDGMGDAATAAKVAQLLSQQAKVEVWMPPRVHAERLFDFLPATALLGDRLRLPPERAPPDLLVWINCREQSGPYLVPSGDVVPVLHVLEYDLIPSAYSWRAMVTGFGRLSTGIFVTPLTSGAAEAAPRAHGLGAGRQRLAEGLGLVSFEGPGGGPPLCTCYPCGTSLPTVVDTCLRYIDAASCGVDILFVAKHLPTARRAATALFSPDGLAPLEVWDCSPPTAERVDGGGGGASQGDAGEGRCRLLITPPLSADLFALALSLSDFAVVTGDQSLSEAIALGLPLAFDAPGHKHASRANLAALASEAAGESAQRAIGDGLPGCADFLRRPGAVDGLRTTFASVVRHLDVAPRLLGRCLQSLGPSAPLAAAYSRLLPLCQPPWSEAARGRLARAFADLGRDLEDLSGAAGTSPPGAA